ncbi:MAG: histidinol-phosphate transaminase [bacterium]
MIKPRKAVKNFAPYVAGKPIEEIKRIYKLKKVIKLASNENPYPPPEGVIKKIRTLAKSVNRYPDSNGYAVKKEIAKTFGIKPDCIVIGSGVDEIIELLAKAYLEPEDGIIVSQYSFIRYEMAARLMNAKVKIIKMKKFTHNLRKMAGAAKQRDKFIFIDNPDNPTGTYNTKSEIEEMFEILKKRKSGVIPVFDEAYADFTTAKDYVSMIKYFKKGKKIIILRTFSKTYAMAGLRFGFAVAPAEICGVIERIRPPFNTTLISQAAAIEALRNKKYVNEIRRKILPEKKNLARALNAMGCRVVPSETNFLLVKVGNGEDIFKKLLKMGVIVRAMDEYGLPEYIRVTVGKPSENRFFLKCLKKTKTGGK